MKVDIYTKIILTVIAVCLTVIVLRDIDIVSEAQAQARELASGEDVINVQLVGIKKTHRAPWDMLPVEVKNRDALDVKVKNLASIPVTIR